MREELHETKSREISLMTEGVERDKSWANRCKDLTEELSQSLKMQQIEEEEESAVKRDTDSIKQDHSLQEDLYRAKSHFLGNEEALCETRSALAAAFGGEFPFPFFFMHNFSIR